MQSIWFVATQSNSTLYTAVAGHLAPDTDIEPEGVPRRKLPRCIAICCDVIYQVLFDRGAGDRLQANQPVDSK